MTRKLVSLLVTVAALCACHWQASGQTQPGRLAAARLSTAEQADLDRGLSEAGSSSLEYLRALEKHLSKYPDSPRKNEFERAAVRAAMELNDEKRTVIHGERVLERDPDDLQILERVTRALLTSDSADAAQRALTYASRYEGRVRQLQKESTRPPERAAEWLEQTDRGISQALVWQARANENLGRLEIALTLARRAFALWPNADAARETASCQERLGKIGEAAAAMADAFTIPDFRTTDADRMRDRGRIGDLYRRAHGAEAGLGELILEAYDRNVKLIHAREQSRRASDPNGQLTNPMDFTLYGPGVPALSMAALKGKIVVMDFWATWCIPCKSQHPLYEEVKKRFAGQPEVTFLSITTDEDRSKVEPFLKEMEWSDAVYYEAGLSRALKISSIPTTLVIDRSGQVFSRLNGYRPDRFVDMLSSRIHDALEN